MFVFLVLSIVISVTTVNIVSTVTTVATVATLTTATTVTIVTTATTVTIVTTVTVTTVSTVTIFTGTRTQVALVKADYPRHLDYTGSCQPVLCYFGTLLLFYFVS